MGYLQTFSPTEYIVKAVKRLPNHLRNSFYKSHSNIILERNNFVSLEQFEKWLDKVKEQFNPIANILSIDQSYRPRDHIRLNNNNQDESQEIKCWFCSDDHKLGSCDRFLSKPLYEKKQFVEKEKLCWNCLAKGHILKSCPCKVSCRIPNYNKRHHTSLHESTQMTTQTNQNIASNNLNNNNLEKNTFLQIIPITISNGTKYIKTNALLDTGSDATLLKGDIAKKLELNGDYKNLRITNAISKTSELESKHVSFKVSSESHPNFIDIENAWVVSDLDIKCQPMNVFKLKKDFDHLRDSDLTPLNPGRVSLLVGTDFPHFLLHSNFKSGESHQPFAVKTLLG